MATLVTGATGFLGTHLVRALLDAGTEVRVLVRSGTDAGELARWPVELVRGDLMEPRTIAGAMRGVDRLFHAAAKVDLATRRAAEMARINADGTRHVLEAAWRAGIDRVVYTSSVGVIGACRVHERLSERDIYRGRGTNLPYTRSKLQADRIAMRFAHRGLPLIPVYPTLFLGPGDRSLHSIRPIVTYLEGRALGYIAGGFGCSDVRDIAAGHLLAMQRGEVGRRYILGGWNVTLRQLYGMLERLTRIRASNLRLPAALARAIASLARWLEPLRRRPPAVTRGDVDFAELYWFYDYTRARNELGLFCRPLLETLRDTVHWLRHGVVATAPSQTPPPPHGLSGWRVGDGTAAARNLTGATA